MTGNRADIAEHRALADKLRSQAGKVREVAQAIADELRRQDPGAMDFSESGDLSRVGVFDAIDLNQVALAAVNATITRADRDHLADLLERRGYSSGITARHEYVHRARHGDTD